MVREKEKVFEVGDVVELREDFKDFVATRDLKGPLKVTQTIPVPDKLTQPAWGHSGGQPLKTIVGHSQWVNIADGNGSVVTNSDGEVARFSGALFKKKQA